jgi:hypothetical protein
MLKDGIIKFMWFLFGIAILIMFFAGMIMEAMK